MTHAEIAEAFSRHDFRRASSNFADDLVWNVVGGELLWGKDAVLQACETASRYLATVSTRFDELRLIDGQEWIVVDSTATYESPDEGTSRVASCDLYRFSEGKLAEITSYNVELPDE